MTDRSPLLAFVTVVAALAVGACRDEGEPQAAAAAPAEANTMDPTPHTLDVIRGHDCWAVAALQCDYVAISERGTRSQTMTLSARVLHASDPRVPSPLNLEHYVADDAILEKGHTYVVILAGTGGRAADEPIAWVVVQRAALAGADPAAAVGATKAAVEAALK
jgi:hypothetical protein